MDLENEPLLTTEQAARKLHCKREFIQKECRERRLPHFTIGRKYLFSYKHLEAYLSKRESRRKIF
jgi:excisionase family DNA binding protein